MPLVRKKIEYTIIKVQYMFNMQNSNAKEIHGCFMRLI